ncbi:unnamed protein product [Urochloa humidicola]
MGRAVAARRDRPPDAAECARRGGGGACGQWEVEMRGAGPPTEALATRPCRLQWREVGIVLFLLPECGKLMVVECKKRNITNTVKMEDVETEQLFLMMKTVS